MSRANRTQTDIQAYGWHVIKVAEDDEGPGFAYSIGLYETFGHPEIIVFGRSIDVMHRIVNNVGEEVRRGQRFGDGDESDQVLVGEPVRFRAVSQSYYDEFLGQAIDHYGSSHFPVLQCYWPDVNRRFPWDLGVLGQCAVQQPSLQVAPPFLSR